MSWMPEGDLGLLLSKLVTRAREDSLQNFTVARKHIEAQEAARGRMGGPVASGCIGAAGEAVKQFSAAVVRDAAAVFESGGALHRESTAWVRGTVNQVSTRLLADWGIRLIR